MAKVSQFKLTDEQFQARMSNQKMISHIFITVVNKVVTSSKGKYFEIVKSNLVLTEEFLEVIRNFNENNIFQLDMERFTSTYPISFSEVLRRVDNLTVEIYIEGNTQFSKHENLYRYLDVDMDVLFTQKDIERLKENMEQVLLNLIDNTVLEAKQDITPMKYEIMENNYMSVKEYTKRIQEKIDAEIATEKLNEYNLDCTVKYVDRHSDLTTELFHVEFEFDSTETNEYVVNHSVLANYNYSTQTQHRYKTSSNGKKVNSTTINVKLIDLTLQEILALATQMFVIDENKMSSKNQILDYVNSLSIPTETVKFLERIVVDTEYGMQTELCSISLNFEKENGCVIQYQNPNIISTFIHSSSKFNPVFTEKFTIPSETDYTQELISEIQSVVGKVNYLINNQ